MMNIFIQILLGVGAVVVTLIIHELGHLFMGLIVGFQFSVFAIGPMLIERTPLGRIRITWNRVPSFYGGVAGTLPLQTDSLGWRFAAVSAAGPCANILLALGATISIAWYAAPHGLLHDELSWVRLISLCIFFATAIPFPNGPFVTDGMRFFRIVRKGPQRDRELSLLTIEALQLRGKRPKDWDASILEKGLAIHDGSIFECQMHLYAYMHALDSSLPDIAKASLQKALSFHVPAVLQRQCCVEAAYLEAAYGANPNRARELLQDVRPSSFGIIESDLLRAQAAIAIAEGDIRIASTMLSQAFVNNPLWATGPQSWLKALEERIGS